MANDARPGFGKLLSVLLIGLLLLVSGAPCIAAPLSARPVASSLDPCKQREAPSTSCAQLACKAFQLPAAIHLRDPLVCRSAPFLAAAVEAQGRFLPPPVPPPRAPIV
jgi:hypothetical protein